MDAASGPLRRLLRRVGHGRTPRPATEAGRRRGRDANPVDHYSLALQLIQVFPIISGSVVVIVASTWLGRVLSAAILIIGTLWIVVRERTGTRRDPRPRGKEPTPRPIADERAQVGFIDVLMPPPRSRPSDGVVHAEVTDGSGDTHEIDIRIRVRPPPTAPTRRHRMHYDRLPHGTPHSARIHEILVRFEDPPSPRTNEEEMT